MKMNPEKTKAERELFEVNEMMMKSHKRTES